MSLALFYIIHQAFQKFSLQKQGQYGYTDTVNAQLLWNLLESIPWEILANDFLKPKISSIQIEQMQPTQTKYPFERTY